jgi:hypothetical protein
MPVCPRCGVAYIEDEAEAHRCERREPARTMLMVFGLVVLGLIILVMGICTRLGARQIVAVSLSLFMGFQFRDLPAVRFARS